MEDLKELETTETPIIEENKTQNIFVDEQGRILGIALGEGVEIESDINFSFEGLTTDYIAKYKYINGEVVERTEEEIEQDRNNVPTPTPSAEEVRFTEIEDALIEVSEMVVENETDTNALAVQIAEIQDALVELAEIITGE